MINYCSCRALLQSGTFVCLKQSTINQVSSIIKYRISSNDLWKVIDGTLDKEKKRISLGIKQTEPNPWENILNEYKNDQIIDTEIKNITEFGIFAKLNENIDGLIHKNDLSWTDSNGDRT